MSEKDRTWQEAVTMPLRPIQEPSTEERIGALERRVEALVAARCPECHADLGAYDHKMDCGRGGGRGLRLSVRSGGKG